MLYFLPVVMILLASCSGSSKSRVTPDRNAALQAAQGLRWAEVGVSIDRTLTANWTPSTGGRQSQELSVYTDATCTQIAGSPIGLLPGDLKAKSVTLAADGTYYFAVKSLRDGSDGVTSACSSAVKVDATAPSAANNLVWSIGGYSQNTSLIAVWQPSSSRDLRSQSFLVYKDSNCGTTGSPAFYDLTLSQQSLNFISPAAGTYTFKIRSTDASGLVTDSPCSHAIVVDLSDPGAAIGLSWSQGSLSQASTVTALWSASLDSDLASQELRLFNDPACNVSASPTLSALASSLQSRSVGPLLDGTYYFQIVSIDKADRRTNSACSAGMRVDTVAPAAATSLVWAQGASFETQGVTAQWTPSTTPDLASQEVRVYKDSACSALLGSAVTGLATNISSQGVTVPGGFSFYFRIRSIDAAGLSTNSLCSAGIRVESLAATYKNFFKIGTALNTANVIGRAALVKQHFNLVTPENQMKWNNLEAVQGITTYADADALVNFATANSIDVVGHTLLWWESTPAWVFTDGGGPASTAVVESRLENHIKNTIGRYKSQVHRWDVVNEALSDDANPSVIYRNSQLNQIAGSSHIKKSLQWAAQADSTAELWYNDYNLENPSKLAKLIIMIDDLQAQNVPLHGIGLEGHYTLGWPTEAMIRTTVDAIIAKGLKVKVSELDVTIYDDYGSGSYVPEAQKPCDATVLSNLANRYNEVFTIFRSYQANLASISVWGLTDNESWLNNFPVNNRANCPLLFDSGAHPKSAFDRILQIP